MAAPFKLSRELLGHSADVRAVTVLHSGHIVTGSRDNTIKVWNPDNLSETKTLSAHQKYVGSLATLTPTEDSPTRIFASGGHDRVIFVWDISADIESTSNNNNNSNTNNSNNSNEPAPITFLTGHENAVTSISATVDGDIISGSWDKTVRIWKFGTCVQELKGHEHAVWAVLGLPNGDVVTASADSTIKIWRGPVGSMECIKTLKDHKDCVRGLALIPGIGFVSCANDETLIVWSMGGDLLQTLYGHTAYVYTVDVLRVSQDNYLIISGSEDRTLKVWKDGECVQTITHPSGVWCVAAAQDRGDIVSGCADGVARVWSQNAQRIADPETIQTYEANVASSSVHKSAVGDLDLSKLPGSEALQTKRGTKDGEHLIVKTATGGAELYSWSMAEDKWAKIGDVVDSSQGGKESLYGKEYDYVFDIDVGDGMNKKLGYNKGENPYLVAQEFLHREELNQEFLDQVAQFIIKNADVTPMTLGGPAPASDPFTGGSRYIPGSSSSGSRASASSAPRAPAPQSDPFTGKNRYAPYTAPTPSNPAVSNSYFPQQTMTAYEGGNLAGLQQKLTEFSAVVNNLTPEEQTQITALLNVLKDTARYHSSRVTEDQIRIVIKKLLAWPAANLLPVLDLLRLLFTHSHAAEILGSVKTTPTLYEILYNIAIDITVPTNSMLALRCFANMFKLTGARKLIEPNQQALMDLLLVAIGSDNKNVTHAASTIALNFTVLYRTQPNDTGIARIAAVLAKALEQPALPQDVALRCVIAAGTLAANPAGFALARTHLTALLPPLCASTDKDLGPAARALAQSFA